MKIDIQHTRDGFLVLMHDDTLDRTTTGSGLVAECRCYFYQSRSESGGSFRIRSSARTHALAVSALYLRLELVVRVKEFTVGMAMAYDFSAANSKALDAIA